MAVRPVTGRRRHVLAGIVTAAATLAASGALLALSPAAHATSADNETVLSHLNALRARHGLPALVESADLMSIAAGHSAAMSRSGQLYHNPDLTTEVSNWEVLGENVGMGPSATAIDTAFDNSPEHYANEVGSAYTQVGIGTVRASSGYLFITVDFRKPMYASTPVPAKPPVAKAPTPAPKPPTPVTVVAAKAPSRATSTTESAAAEHRAFVVRLAAERAAAHRVQVARARVAEARAQQARVAAVRAAAARQATSTATDPLGRALSFSRTLTAMAG